MQFSTKLLWLDGRLVLVADPPPQLVRMTQDWLGQASAQLMNDWASELERDTDEWLPETYPSLEQSRSDIVNLMNDLWREEDDPERN